MGVNQGQLGSIRVKLGQLRLIEVNQGQFWSMGSIGINQGHLGSIEQGAADRLKHTRDENRRGSILHTFTKRR